MNMLELSCNWTLHNNHWNNNYNLIKSVKPKLCWYKISTLVQLPAATRKWQKEMLFSGWFYAMLSLCKQSPVIKYIVVFPTNYDIRFDWNVWMNKKKFPLSTKKTAQNRTKPASKIKYKIYTMDGNCERINISVGDFCVCGLFFLCGVCLCVCVQECHGKKRNFKALIFIELSIEDGPFRLQNIFDALCLAYKRTEASARELTI